MNEKKEKPLPYLMPVIGQAGSIKFRMIKKLKWFIIAIYLLIICEAVFGNHDNVFSFFQEPQQTMLNLLSDLKALVREY